MEIWNEKECVLSGQRKPGNDTHLWMINLEEEREIAGEKEVVIQRESIAIAYQTKINLESDYDRVAFAHATMGSPPWERFAQSIKSGFINIAGVTHEMARRQRRDTWINRAAISDRRKGEKSQKKKKKQRK